MEAKGEAKICDLRLFGDWQLKIKFTYDLRDVSEEVAEMVKLPASKMRNRHHEEEVKLA